MIKIFLNSQNRCPAEWGSYSFVEWRKGNKGYKCFRNVDGETKTIDYSLFIIDFPSLSIRPLIVSDSLADINKRIKKTNIEIEEY
jgi:hypothetical protein